MRRQSKYSSLNKELDVIKKILVVLGVFSFCSTSFAAKTSLNEKTYSCVGKTKSGSLLVEFNAKYGELVVVDSNGKTLVDEDGYQTKVLNLESIYGIHVNVVHHEEPKVSVLIFEVPHYYSEKSIKGHLKLKNKSLSLVCL